MCVCVLFKQFKRIDPFDLYVGSVCHRSAELNNAENKHLDQPNPLCVIFKTW